MLTALVPYGALLIISIGLWVVFLRLGLRFAKVEGVTGRRIGGVVLLSIVLQLLVLALFQNISSTNPQRQLLLELTQFGLLAFVTVVSIAWVFRTSLIQAIKAWLSGLIGNIVAAAFTYFVFIPYVLEAYKIEANSMTPTLLGEHWIGTCTKCGGLAYRSPDKSLREPDDSLMICRDHFHVMEPSTWSEQIHQRDRAAANKLLTPRRWDLVVFRKPDDPSMNFIKRLIGLPGETIAIKGGAVWVNGTKLTPPESLAGIEYGSLEEVWPADGVPAKLADDEFFVLGDFSRNSFDSRLWQQGAPGHPPYAVPRSHLVGVVTHIYWPPSRWRTFR